MPQTVSDLGKAVKEKYAGQYDDLPDDELGRRIQAKFPGAYDDYAPVPVAQPPATTNIPTIPRPAATPAQPVAAPAQPVAPRAVPQLSIPSPAAAVASAQDIAAKTVKMALNPDPAPAAWPGTGQGISAQPAPGFFERLAAPFVGPGSLYGNLEAQRTGARIPYNPDAPLVDFGANAKQISGGAVNKGFTTAAQDFLSGFTTLKSISLLLATGGLGGAGKLSELSEPAVNAIAKTGAKWMPRIQRLVSAGFSIDMIRSALEQSPQLIKQIKTGDTEGATHTLTTMLGSLGMGAAAGVHAAKGVSAEVKGRAAPEAPPASEPQYTTTGQRIGGEPPAAPRPPRAPKRPKGERPEVPSEGPSEGVQRAVHARENLTQQMFPGRTWDDLKNSERLAIDALISEGYGHAVQPPEKPAPSPPAQPHETPAARPARTVEKKAPKGWDSVPGVAHVRHPSVDLSDGELRARAKNKPLPMPEGAPESMRPAWNVVSRIAPELAGRITGVGVLPEGSAENAAIDVSTGRLRIHPARPLTPETLWHEAIHLDQPEARAGRLALDPDKFNSLEAQSRAGIKDALGRFRKIEAPEPEKEPERETKKQPESPPAASVPAREPEPEPHAEPQPGVGNGPAPARAAESADRAAAPAEAHGETPAVPAARTDVKTAQEDFDADDREPNEFGTKAETLEHTKGRDWVRVHVIHAPEGWTVRGELNLAQHGGGHLGDSGYKVFHPTREAAVRAFVASAIENRGPDYIGAHPLHAEDTPLGKRERGLIAWIRSLSPGKSEPSPTRAAPKIQQPDTAYLNRKRIEGQRSIVDALEKTAAKPGIADSFRAKLEKRIAEAKAKLAALEAGTAPPLGAPEPIELAETPAAEPERRRAPLVRKLIDQAKRLQAEAADEVGAKRSKLLAAAAKSIEDADRYNKLDDADAALAAAKTKVARDVAPETGPHGPILRNFRHDAAGAIAELRRRKSGDAIAALHHPEIGDIDLIWGRTGDPAKDFKGGYGLAHIDAKHPDIADRLADIIPGLQKGEIQGGNRQLLVGKDHRAVVGLDWNEQAKRWLLTAYEEKPPRPEEFSSGSGRAGVEGPATPSRGVSSDSSVAETPAVVPPAQPHEAPAAPAAPKPPAVESKGGEDGSGAGPDTGGKSGALQKNAAPGGDQRAGEDRPTGNATDIVIPGEKRRIPARYRLRELADLQPSHNGQTFAANPLYGLKNERDYSKPENQERVIQQSSEENFTPAIHISDDPTLANGPTLTDEEGNAIGGNSRLMQLQRVYGRDGGKAAEYRALLEQKAAQFGLDPEAVRAMKEPVLVREASDEDLAALPGGVQWAVRKTNVSGTAALSSSERAAADAGQMSPDMMGHIAAAIENAGPDATLNDALTGQSGTRIVNMLIGEGFFSEQERPSLMDGKTGALTQLAKDRISKALLGKFFRDSDQIARTPAALKAKLERIAAPLAKVAGNAEWDLTPEVQQAIDLIEYANAHGVKNLGDVVSQESMFGDAPEWTPRAITLAGELRDAKPNDVVNAFRRYVNSKEPTMFGESTPDEAFADAFGEAPKGGGLFGSRSGAISPNLLGIGAAHEFLKQDVAPRLREVAGAIRDSYDDIAKLLFPTLHSRSGKVASMILRGKLGELARKTDQAAYAVRAAFRYFEGQKPDDNYAFIDRMEHGDKQPTLELQSIADALRALYDGRRREVQALGKGRLRSFYENYFAHIWAKPERAKTVFAAFFGKRPIEGPKAFLKKRTYPTFRDGLDAGLKPVSDNPVTLTLMKIREMDRYIMAHEALKELGPRYVDAREGRPPKGWRKIEDAIGTVYGPSIQNISEFPNEGIYRGLEAVADALGVKHKRGFQPMGDALGRAWMGQRRIETKHGTAESVFAHEIGHQIDALSGSGRRFVLEYPDAQTVARLKRAYATLKDKGSTAADRKAARQELKALKGAIADRKEFAKQLRDLADLRTGGSQAYRRSRQEKMAQLAQMWVEGRAAFERTAPKVFAEWKKFLDENPKLHALRDIEAGANTTAIAQPYDVGGLVIRGHWYLPDGAARVLDNYLSPGLNRYASFRGAMGLNNAMNLFNLGLSGFHVTKTGVEAMISRGAIGLEEGMRGHPVEAAKHIAAAPAAPFRAWIRGSKMLREWYTPGSQGAVIGKLMDELTGGGARARLDQMYRTSIGESMMRAFQRGNPIGGAARAPFAGMEGLTKLIMDEVVPRIKMGTMAEMAEAELKRLGPDADPADVRRVMTEVVNSVDNRMGEVARDNFFVHRFLKDASMFLMRADQYTLGTVREIGGAGVDLVRQPYRASRGEPVNLKRIAYVGSMLMTHMAIAALYQYLHTGKWPEEAEDYFYPKNGETDENLKPQRTSLWTYVKDVHSFARHPWRTIENKVAPAIALALSLIQNRDFRNVQIRDADAPATEQAKQTAGYVAKQFEPRSVENARRERGLGATPGQLAEQFMGLSPAPSDLDRSPAERMAAEITGEKSEGEARSQESDARRELRLSLTRALRANKPVPKDVLDAIKAGTLRSSDIKIARANASHAPLQREFASLSIKDGLKVFRVATPAEKKLLRRDLLLKARRALASGAPADRAAIVKATRDALATVQ
jgi:ddrB-like ParB superfamily domain/phage-Barnase-EndoU-ColicinE5/D-RelE like nuclease1